MRSLFFSIVMSVSIAGGMHKMDRVRHTVEIFNGQAQRVWRLLSATTMLVFPLYAPVSALQAASPQCIAKCDLGTDEDFIPVCKAACPDESTPVSVPSSSSRSTSPPATTIAPRSASTTTTPSQTGVKTEGSLITCVDLNPVFNAQRPCPLLDGLCPAFEYKEIKPGEKQRINWKRDGYLPGVYRCESDGRWLRVGN
ncbi:hypothetical protein WSK_4128 [Novosphingobium sp. Rr 2-17]|nr:hypothetical protein WSK_4128 [Novosphingobium sp. Rr 2-17]